MANFKPIVIGSIFGGIATTQYAAAEGQYLQGVAIDPDFPISDSSGDFRVSGALRPVAYEKFSGANVDDVPYWITTNPKNTVVYVLTKAGDFISYTSALGSETVIATAATCTGNGMAYYNNYVYVFRNGDVDRYGPLNNSPAYDDAVWTAATLGTQTALTNTTYPSHRGTGTLPNHAAHVHGDGALYFGDFINGQGIIHKIKTTKTTNEGDTNSGSAYNVLDLPFGYMPVDIESYGTDLVIAAIQTNDSTVKQGGAALFFWDTLADSFYRQVDVTDTVITALKMNNGLLYVWSGALNNFGYRLSVYAGGQTLQSIAVVSDGVPPLAGAVDAIGDRVYFGTVQRVQTTTAGSPTYYATVMAYGSQDPRIPKGLHSIAKSTATASSTDGLVTAISTGLQSQLGKTKLLIGWRDGSGYGIDKISTTYGTSVWVSPMVNLGTPFVIKRISFALGAAVAANMTITPKVFVDDFSASPTVDLDVVNSTNFANSERFISYNVKINGTHNFAIELTWTGTALLPVLLPIIIEVEGRSSRDQ